MNIKKRCNKIGCKEFISIAETYCANHTNHNYKQYEQMRTSTRDGREYKRFYSNKEWRSLRYQSLLRDEFICVKCGREAQMVDHIIPTKVDWSKRLDMDNTQSMCNECHNSKTLKDKIEYGI